MLQLPTAPPPNCTYTHKYVIIVVMSAPVRPGPESRAVFMANEGQEVYDAWTSAVLQHADEIDRVRAAGLAATEPAPDTAVQLDHFATSLMAGFKAVAENEAYRTSAAFGRAGARLGNYVSIWHFNSYTDHALDSLNFGVRFPLAVTFDAMRHAFGERDTDT